MINLESHILDQDFERGKLLAKSVIRPPLGSGHILQTKLFKCQIQARTI